LKYDLSANEEIRIIDAINKMKNRKEWERNICYVLFLFAFISFFYAFLSVFLHITII
jgi:hypothetical protein